MPTIKMNQEIAHYVQLGNTQAEKTIVFIPGSGMSEKPMEQLAVLFEMYNNIIVDLPGHGASKGVQRETVGQLADFITAVINELHNEKIISDDVTILGYSLGGFVTVAMGVKQSPIIKRLVVLSSCGNMSTNPLLPMINAPEPPALDLSSMLCGSQTPEEKIKEIGKMMSEDAMSPIVTLKDLRCANGFDLSQEYTRINVPVLVAIGEEDMMIELSRAKELAQNVIDGTFIQYEGVGHGLLFEKTEALANDIKEFLK